MTRVSGRRIKSTIGELLPSPVHDLAGKAYNRVQSLSATREFKRRTLPEVTCDVDAPDHVIVIIVDALRSDSVGDDTPFLSGMTGTDAVTTAPWTFPSVASLLTGMYPHEHGAMRQSDNADNATGEEITLPPPLGEEHTTLPEYLAGAGYETYGAFGFQMPFLSAAGRFQTHRLYRDTDAESLLDDYVSWLSDRLDRQTFAYLHLSDLHEPVMPPEQYSCDHEVDTDIPDIARWDFTASPSGDGAERYRTHRKRLYTAAVDYVDDQLSDLTESLEHLIADDNLAMIVTSDHGEAFWEHSAFDAERFYDSRPAYCVGHGGTPYESIARVPLRTEGVPIREGPVSLVDLAPTVLNLTGIDVPDEMTGIPLSTSVPSDRPLVVQSSRYGHEKKAVVVENHKLLVSPGDECVVEWTLPEEELVNFPTNVRRSLEDELPPWPDGGDQQQVRRSVQRQLQDLGYT